MKQYSIILGAGFSVNKGYPTAKQLNNKISSIKADDFVIHSDGTVYLQEIKSTKNECFNFDRNKDFLVELIQLYQEKNTDFDYEKFYDFYTELNKHQTAEFKIFCDNFRKKFNLRTNNNNLISKISNILNQLIVIFLVDKNGNQYYESIHHCKNLYPGYTGFLNCLEDFGNKGIVHIHSLNHDLFFETFNSSSWLQNNMCDGFEELGSPYYGEWKGNYKIRFSYFANIYDKKFRLYKLHGSIDQFPFHVNSAVDNYIKSKPEVPTTNFYKEDFDKNGNLVYVNDWVNYHPDFLTGTTSKILRYREQLYYGKLFDHFEKNLLESDTLIIIGYGCGDTEINNIIEQKFDFTRKKMFVIEPFPSQKTFDFIDKFKATLIVKTPDNLTIIDIA